MNAEFLAQFIVILMATRKIATDTGLSNTGKQKKPTEGFGPLPGFSSILRSRRMIEMDVRFPRVFTHGLYNMPDLTEEIFTELLNRELEDVGKFLHASCGENSVNFDPGTMIHGFQKPCSLNLIFHPT